MLYPFRAGVVDVAGAQVVDPEVAEGVEAEEVSHKRTVLPLQISLLHRKKHLCTLARNQPPSGEEAVVAVVQDADEVVEGEARVVDEVEEPPGLDLQRRHLQLPSRRSPA